jgi:hypothetical protein
MAKSLKKLPDFYAGHRKQCRLVTYQALSTKAEEKRIKAQVEILLSNDPQPHMPECFVDPFGLMDKQESPLSLTKIGAICESMTVDLYETESSSSATRTVTGCNIQDFRIIGEGEKDKREVMLEFTVYMPADSPLSTWCFTHLKKHFYLEAVPAQGALFDNKTTSIADKPAPKDKPAADTKPKSGPAELKKFHEAHGNKKASGRAASAVQ